MKKIILSTILVISFQLGYSQTVIKSPVLDPNNKKTKTLKISTIDLSEKTVLDIKDEFIGWNEKVVSATVVKNNREFILIHNDLMDETDLFDVLKKYNIKKEDIISYK